MDIILIPVFLDCSIEKQTFKNTLLSILAICSVISVVKVWKRSPKTSLIPQLPSVPFVGPFYPLLWQRDFSKLFLSWLFTYGSTFQTNIMGTDVVLLSNPKWIKKLLTSSVPGHLSKYPFLYNILFSGILRQGLIPQPDVSKWKHHRSILSKAFSLESLKADLKVMNRHAKQLSDKMNEIDFEDDFWGLPKRNETYSLHASLRESTSHTTEELFYGLGYLTKGEKLVANDKFARRQDLMQYRLEHPWCISETIWNFVSQKKEMDSVVNSITTTFVKLANRARENLKTEKSIKTLLDLMIKGGLDNEEIVSEFGSFVTAVHDTQTSALNAFLFILSLYPKYQAECRKEIDEIFESKNKTSGAFNEELSWDDLSQMKYLEMCIYESLRMFTPIPAFARELKSPLHLEEDLVLDKGTVVIVCPALIHRDPQIFPDPNNYNPDRFLPENCKARSSYSYLPFSKGLRGCIGQKMSMMQIKLLVAYILRDYELYPENKDYNLSNIWETTIWRTKDLGVRWKKRT